MWLAERGGPTYLQRMNRDTRHGPAARPLLHRLARLPLVLLAVIVVVLEATVWRWLTALGHGLARLAPFAALERLVARLSPRMVVAVFALPFLAFIPLLKFGEIWLFLHGHVVLGVLLLVGAKVVGVAFSARLFEIARPKMLQVPAFAWAYGHAVRLWAACHGLLESLPAWVAARAFLHHLGAAGRALLATGWQALRALFGRAAGGGAGGGTGGRTGGGTRARLAAAIRLLRRPAAIPVPRPAAIPGPAPLPAPSPLGRQPPRR